MSKVENPIINLITEPIKKILYPWIPKNLITDELGGLYGDTVLKEMGEIIKYYNIYENGAEFVKTTSTDYVPSDLHFKKIKTVIDKEARFMFAKTPEINLRSITNTEADNDKVDIYRQYIDVVLKKSHFKSAIAKAAKDCFIGKRVAVVCNFNEETGITLKFIPSLEFTYELDENDRLKKFIIFFSLNNAVDKDEQRIQKKKYWVENGFCHISENIYNGNGDLVEELITDEITKFNYIPATVIINGSLLGDVYGESEVASLYDYEVAYSKLANEDMDSERKSMNAIIYSVDMTPASTKGLQIAPGAYWDLESNTLTNESAKGQIGVLETGMNYSEPLNTTLKRINNTMYENVDMPSITPDDLQGIVTSGKSLKAIYWSLIVRCDEKFLVWGTELEFIIKCLIDGALLYPAITKQYISENLQEVEYTINIENQYALPEDEDTEKQIDMAEVSTKTRSIKSYLKKWQRMTDEDADKEIEQILKEQTIFQSASAYVPPTFE